MGPGDDPHTLYLHAVLASTSSIAPGACITQQPAPRGSRWPGVQRCISSNRGTNWTDAAPGGVAIVLHTAVAVHKLGIA